jgi:hypothetical protein
VEEGMNFDMALQKLNSPEQQQIVASANEMLTQELGGGTVESAIGDWSDGAENSSIIHSATNDKAKFDYVMASLGMQFNQKAVISFIGDLKGKDAVWSFQATGDMNQIRAKLDEHQIQFRTLVPNEQGAVVHVFDQGMNLGENVLKAANAFGSHISVVRGSGTFLGGDTREEGRRIYSEVIGAYKKGQGIRAARYPEYYSGRNRLFGRGP